MDRAYLCHRAGGRSRIRIPDRRRDAEFFDWAARELADCDGIEAVIANPVTGSLLVSHSCTAESLAHRARDLGLFELVPGPVPVPTLTQQVGRGGALVSRTLGDWTGGRVDMAVVAFLFFVTLGVAQMVRGRVAIPAITAFWYAASVVLMSRKAAKE